ncbi:MAG: YwbE family protein [Nitrososphaeraceae archaeon]
MESIKRKDIKPGTIVKIVEKQNQKTGELTEGIVKKILTSSATHPYGIKVILESGIVGRVKEIVNK